MYLYGELMKETIDTAMRTVLYSLKDRWIKVKKEDIELADGRKVRDNPISQSGSCLYIAYSGEKVLYVGETSKSIKKRFISDGSGSHLGACSWYSELSHVLYIKFKEDELPVMYRKLLEQALSIHYMPTYYGSRT